MAEKKKIFISFDYDNDRNYKNMLLAWDANKEFDFSFNDCSSQEINSDDVSTVKGVLTEKINSADYTLVLIGQDCNKLHPDSYEIGYLNWQVYEIVKSKEAGNKLIAVKIKKEYSTPPILYGCGVSWAMSFTYDSIKRAINNA